MNSITAAQYFLTILFNCANILMLILATDEVFITDNLPLEAIKAMRNQFVHKITFVVTQYCN